MAALLVLGLGACQKDNGDSNQTQFDRASMLANYADKLIIPAYKDVQTALEQMISTFDAFSNTPSLAQLEEAQTAWTNAYRAWMYANAYNVGPAAEQGLNKSLQEEIATFPASADKIDAALSAGQFNFSDFNRDARGFLTLEYLLFGGLELDNQQVLDLFLNRPFRHNYLAGCAANIQSRLGQVLSAWENGYREEFLSRSGTDVGSSTSQLYNEFVKSFEANKNFKIELPLGKRPGQTQAEPQLVEAYYSGQSLEFLRNHLQAIEAIYFGRSKDGADGPGFRDYLERVTGGPELVSSTLAQWEQVQLALENIPDTEPLSELIRNEHPSVEALRIELQKHTRFFKSDMSSLLGIAITFSSGDGD
jgi:predicted lipoprotein